LGVRVTVSAISRNLTMASIADIILFLHPTAVPNVDFRVNFADGVTTVTDWDTDQLGPQPSNATILESNGAADAFYALGPVPTQVGPYQIRCAMISLGWAASETLLDTLILGVIDAAITDPAQNEIAKIGWRRASEFKRNHAFIELLRVALSKTHGEIDTLFRTAASF